jgi:hypothetical protein
VQYRLWQPAESLSAQPTPRFRASLSYSLATDRHSGADRQGMNAKQSVGLQCSPIAAFRWGCPLWLLQFRFWFRVWSAITSKRVNPLWPGRSHQETS